ncbi:MAG TPA: N-acetylneuraminate synthase family protein [Alphaproteobacteria bacterium]
MAYRTLEEITGGPNHTFVIAEAGVNHNGDPELAKQLIDAAANAGADAVKFQTFQADKLASPEAAQADYQARNIGKKESQLQMLQRLELKFTDHAPLKKYAQDRGIMFLSTPFHVEALKFLIDDIGQDTLKFSSGDLANAPLLNMAARRGVNMLVSTGMASIEEVRLAFDAIAFGYCNPRDPKSSAEIKDWRLKPEAQAIMKTRVCVFHCTTAYPTPLDMVNLRAMKTLEAEFKCITGYSDHTQGIDVSILASALGARVIEKHFTISRDWEGPDHVASLEPQELKAMIDNIRATSKARAAKSDHTLSLDEARQYLSPTFDAISVLGTGEKQPHKGEVAVTEIARKSIHTRGPIKAGEVFTMDNLSTDIRPQGGLKPVQLWDILGKPAANDLAAYQPVKNNNVA